MRAKLNQAVLDQHDAKALFSLQRKGPWLTYTFDIQSNRSVWRVAHIRVGSTRVGITHRGTELLSHWLSVDSYGHKDISRPSSHVVAKRVCTVEINLVVLQLLVLLDDGSRVVHLRDG